MKNKSCSTSWVDQKAPNYPRIRYKTKATIEGGTEYKSFSYLRAYPKTVSETYSSPKK